MIAGIVGVIALVVILLLLTGAFTSQGTVIPASTCAANVVTYANANIVQPGTQVSLISVSETHGLYEVKISYQSQAFSLYTTKDCSLLFTANPLNMNAPRATPAPAPAPVKSARPTVNLYIMAFCPYGTQVETVMRPVYDLLGEKADIRIRYITTVTGTSIESVDSLHGITEAKEDAFQACVGKAYPGSYWEYLRLFNQQCYPKWNNNEVLDTCRRNVTSTLGIDHVSVESCSQGPEGIALLKTDMELSNADRAFSSPSLVINGVEYNGARNPEAYKQAICNSFDTAPEECRTVLSTSSATSSGSC